MRGEDYLESERVNNLSPPAEIFYFRLLCAVDAHGKLDARPALLRTKLYALQLDKKREADLPRLLQECEQAGLVRSYTVGGKPYLIVPNFRQRLRAASKYPDPPTPTPDCHMSVTCPSHDGRTSATCPHEEDYEDEEEKEEERENNTPPPSTTSIFRSLEERESYRHWLRSIKAAHPAGRERATLDHNLHTVAIASFRSAPTAHQHADLLRAFYDSNLDTSTKGRPFKKPMEFRWFLVDLADVIVSAKQWAKETRWKPRTKNTPSNIQNPKSNIQNNDLATQEETAAFLADMREALAAIGQPPPSDYIITD